MNNPSDSRRIDVQLGARSYPIRIGAGLLEQSSDWHDYVHGKHVVIVSNEVVAPLYLQRATSALADHDTSCVILPDGESYKTLESTRRVFDALAELKASRDASIIALGGGVIGDLAGFAAACWMRGIACVQMPTTLLAMVDSSVGGKTGVNLPQGKNLVGAFHQPRAVVIDTDTLATLPDRELHAGCAEIVKYGALGDADFFAWLETNAEHLLRRDPVALQYAIATSCAHKAAIVARDENERGERALLNLGHTFGHALETVSGYRSLLHGEAVAIGMCLAAQASARLRDAPTADAERLAALLQRLKLPTRIPDGIDTDAVLASMQLDKKNLSGRLRLILWRRLGQAELVDGIDADALRPLLASG